MVIGFQMQSDWHTYSEYTTCRDIYVGVMTCGQLDMRLFLNMLYPYTIVPILFSPESSLHFLQLKKIFFWCACSQLRKNMPCTSLPCYWLPPTFKTVRFARICDIDFTAPPPPKKQATTKSSSASATLYSSLIKSNLWHETISQWAWQFFFKTLQEIGKPVAILSIVPRFCEAYVPLHVKGDLPSPLKNL